VNELKRHTTPPATPLEGVKRIREMLTPEGTWTQGCYFRTYPSGPQRWSEEPNKAIGCACLEGAAILCTFEGPFTRLWGMVFDDEWGNPVVRFNDKPGRTHAEVLSKLDELIAKIEANPERFEQ
jgi:hypothetical protein